ncbi:Uncharacterised protein [Shigella sonnei]|nr:Uncharacterised protein [Shigella sonnei]
MLDNLIGAQKRQTCAIGKKKGHQQNSAMQNLISSSHIPSTVQKTASQGS